MDRGEVWWADLPPPAGRRPVLLLSRNSAYEPRTNVTLAPITRTIRSIPTEVRLTSDDGMPQECIVSLDDITTVPKSLLASRITTLSEARMREVATAIRHALALPSS